MPTTDDAENKLEWDVLVLTFNEPNRLIKALQ